MSLRPTWSTEQVPGQGEREREREREREKKKRISVAGECSSMVEGCSTRFQLVVLSPCMIHDLLGLNDPFIGDTY